MAMSAEIDGGQDNFQLPDPITGPSAWYGPEMSKRTDWVHQLDASEVAEIEAAIAPLVTTEADIAYITREQFMLPKLGPRLESIREEVMAGRGFALLRGLPVEKWSMREVATAYYGIGLYFGNARSQNGKGHILGHVRDLGRDAVNDKTARIYQTRERQRFHTDSCDIVSLICLKTAKSGGFSALASSMTVYNEMHKRRPDLAKLLFAPWATDRRGEVPVGMKPYFQIPIYNWYEGYLSAICAPRYVRSAQRFDDVPNFTPEQLEALDMFEGLADDPTINLEMEFQPGDVQFVQNHVILHDRTSYEDWEEPEKKRHLLRLWLAVPGARPLPEVYAERYGSVTIGDRGGIIVPGTRLNAPLEPV